MSELISGDENRKILYDLILADKTKTDKFLVDELVTELKLVRDGLKEPQTVKRQLNALERRILNKNRSSHGSQGSQGSSPDEREPSSPVPKIFTRSCPPEPIQDPTLADMCEGIYKEDIDEIKTGKTLLMQMLGIGMMILLS